MQNLFGISITDRVTVHSDPASGSYDAYFDGELVGSARSPELAVRTAQVFLRERSAKLQAEREQAEADEAAQQVFDDDAFIDILAAQLGVDADDLVKLGEIFARRNSNA